MEEYVRMTEINGESMSIVLPTLVLRTAKEQNRTCELMLLAVCFDVGGNAECLQDPVTLCAESDKWHDVNVVTSLLKLFFRKLPESLITDGKSQIFLLLSMNLLSMICVVLK